MSGYRTIPRTEDRILFLITGLAYGGAETQLVHLASRLKARGWGVNIVSMLQPQAYKEELYALGIPVASLNMRRGVPDPQAIFRLRELLHEWQPQILHSHMVHANILARITTLLYRVPVVISTIHSMNEGGRMREIAYRITDPLSTLTTVISHVVAEHYIKAKVVPRKKLRVVPNGIDIQRFNPNVLRPLLPRKEMGLESEFVWLAIGRFEAAKDYPNLLKAFAQVTIQHPGAQLLIAGEGSLKSQLEELAQSMKLKENVHLLGLRKDIPLLMTVANAYVMSSAWEGLPLVLLEASASGLPIVATDVGGNREVVLEGKSGFLVSPRSPDDLANAMLKLMALSREERNHMGRIGKKHIEENYSLNKVVEMWEGLYAECMAAKEKF